MNFAASAWLWVLLLVPALYAAYSWNHRRRRQRLEKLIDPALWGAVVPEVNWNAGLRKARLWCLALAFGVVALAQPQWGKREEVLSISGLDVMVVLDVSQSMMVEDVVPSRLNKAKHMVKSIAEQLEGDRLGLVAFAASAYLAAPLTTDLNYISETIDVLSPATVLNQGTDIGSALQTAVRALDRGAVQNGEEVKNTGTRVVVLMTDGEDHEGVMKEAAASLSRAGVKLYVIGIGTEKGGPIPVRDNSGQLHGYKRDGGKAVVSTFQPHSLIQLASNAGGKYWTATQNESEIGELLGEIKSLSRGEYGERRLVLREDRYQIPLAVALILLFLETSIPARAIRLGAMTAILFSIALPSAHAAPDGELKTYLENQEGLGAFEDGNLDEAKKRFGSAEKLSPDLPELKFNQGVVELQNGNNDEAAEAFEWSANEALRMNKQDLAAKSLFNQGLAHSRSGDRDGAIDSYLKALAMAKASGNKKLETDTRKNIELLMQKPPQQQQQKGEQENKDSESQEKQNQDQKKSQSEEEKNEKDQKDQKKKPERFASPQQKKKFQSEKLSKEDVERVMAELSNRERELQKKLRKQPGQKSQSGKTW